MHFLFLLIVSFLTFFETSDGYTTIGNTLYTNVAMYSGEALLTCDGLIRLIMQTDGNLVEYDSSNNVLWASGTNGQGSPPYRLRMQGDGNLVIYDKFLSVIWATNIFGSNAYLVLQTNANAVIYSDSGVLWASSSPDSG